MLLPAAQTAITFAEPVKVTAVSVCKAKHEHDSISLLLMKSL
jgi:hypothetical protein